MVMTLTIERKSVAHTEAKSVMSSLGQGFKFIFGHPVISFVMIAAAVYFFIVMPVNAYTERRNRGVAPPDPTAKRCPECLSEIPIAAKRCAFCTSPVGSAAGASV